MADQDDSRLVSYVDIDNAQIVVSFAKEDKLLDKLNKATRKARKLRKFDLSGLKLLSSMTVNSPDWVMYQNALFCMLAVGKEVKKHLNNMVSENHFGILPCVELNSALEQMILILDFHSKGLEKYLLALININEEGCAIKMPPAVHQKLIWIRKALNDSEQVLEKKLLVLAIVTLSFSFEALGCFIQRHLSKVFRPKIFERVNSNLSKCLDVYCYALRHILVPPEESFAHELLKSAIEEENSFIIGILAGLPIVKESCLMRLGIESNKFCLKFGYNLPPEGNDFGQSPLL